MSSHHSENRFIVVGERRSGTSSLAKYLQSHPEIFLHPELDKAYFLDDQIRGKLEYETGSIDRTQWENNHSKEEYEQLLSANSGKTVGEKSADYLHWHPCIDRIAEWYPDMKIVISLRNPVDRAWSHYWNEVGKKREWLSFESAIQEEDSRVSGSDYAKVHLSYKTRGRYIENINYLLTKFPKEQVHIIVLEHLLKNPKQIMSALYEFLGVDKEKGLEIAGRKYNHNWTTIPREFWQKSEKRVAVESRINRLVKKVGQKLIRDGYKRKKYIPMLESITRRRQQGITMPPEMRERLLNYYQESNRKLEQAANLDLSVWND